MIHYILGVGFPKLNENPAEDEILDRKQPRVRDSIWPLPLSALSKALLRLLATWSSFFVPKMSDRWYICFNVALPALRLQRDLILSSEFRLPEVNVTNRQSHLRLSSFLHGFSLHLRSGDGDHESRAASLRLGNLLKYPVTCDAPFLFKSCGVSMSEIKETVMCAGSACDAPPSCIFFFFFKL